MTRAQLISMWTCVAWFLFVLASSANRFLWGNLGVFRPSDPDAESAVVAKSRVVALLNGWAQDYNRAWLLFAIGIVILCGLMLWVTVTHKRSSSYPLQLNGDARHGE